MTIKEEAGDQLAAERLDRRGAPKVPRQNQEQDSDMHAFLSVSNTAVVVRSTVDERLENLLGHSRRSLLEPKMIVVKGWGDNGGLADFGRISGTTYDATLTVT